MMELQVLYLDCHPNILIQRYSETRRRHPLATAFGPEEGVEREIDLLLPIKARADHLIDTTDLTVVSNVRSPTPNKVPRCVLSCLEATAARVPSGDIAIPVK